MDVWSSVLDVDQLSSIIKKVQNLVCGSLLPLMASLLFFQADHVIRLLLGFYCCILVHKIVNFSENLIRLCKISNFFDVFKYIFRYNVFTHSN